jgi:flagellar assembly factor FliW
MSNLIIIHTERFGEISIPENEVIFFTEGLLGFCDFKHYILIQEAAYEPFLWLQSVEDPALTFVIVDPSLFVPDYRVEIKQSELSALELKGLEDARVMVIVVLREDPSLITANLQGPIIINPLKSLGKQIVLLTDKYHTRHSIMKELEEHGVLEPGDIPDSNAYPSGPDGTSPEEPTGR